MLLFNTKCMLFLSVDSLTHQRLHYQTCIYVIYIYIYKFVDNFLLWEVTNCTLKASIFLSSFLTAFLHMGLPMLISPDLEGVILTAGHLHCCLSGLLALRYRTQSKTGFCLLKRLVLLDLKQMSPKLQMLDLGAAAGIICVVTDWDGIPACFF